VRAERLSWDGRDPVRQAAALRALPARPPALEAEAAAIVDAVRTRGDPALRELTVRFDAPDLAVDELSLRVDPSEIAQARDLLTPELIGALEVAGRNIQAVARAELEAATDAEASLAQGQAVRVVGRPVSSAGIYAPGGRAAYPSSVLMCCVPARVAGVDRIALASPPGPDGRLPPVLLAACSIAVVDEVYAIGGAQAVAALAHGTETIAPVDVIVGPGNRYVNAAKRLVFGVVGIDGIAGPTELAVVLDGNANSRWVALDLLAQAEHGSDGLLVAICADGGALDALVDELEALASERASVADATVALVEAPDLSAAVELADAIAPEHLELAFDGADAQIAADRVAGCVFFGPTGAVAFGDYSAGSNHVLPTGGAARFGGPLGIGAFRRHTSVIDLPPPSAARLAPRVAELAEAEGFPVHGESAEARAAD
jgi:histidinol dehydrogenase